MLGLMILKEAVHSTALEHPEDCGCVVCRAAGGDEDAWLEVSTAALTREEGRGG